MKMTRLKRRRQKRCLFSVSLLLLRSLPLSFGIFRLKFNFGCLLFLWVSLFFASHECGWSCGGRLLFIFITTRNFDLNLHLRKSDIITTTRLSVYHSLTLTCVYTHSEHVCAHIHNTEHLFRAHSENELSTYAVTENSIAVDLNLVFSLASSIWNFATDSQHRKV